MAQANDSKLRRVAIEFTTNGYDKGEALRQAGYSVNYSKHNGLKLFEDDRLIKLINECEAKKQMESDYSRAEHLKRLDSLLLALKPQITASNVTAIRAANAILTEIGNSTGLHSQTITNNKIDDIKLTETEKTAIESFNETFKLKLSKGRTA